MKIKFLGAAGTVTGSSYALTSGSGQSILIDLGMFQGPHEIDELNYKEYEYDCNKLSGVVLTHAHLDHCGRLPILLPKGFKESIWMTAPTQDLTELSLLDTAKIARQDNKPILFDKELALKTFDQFKKVEYRESFQVGSFNIMMRDAGHILGSASLEIEDTVSDSPIRKIVFSGDLGNYPEELVKQTEFIDSADAVVMESTYGDRLHPQTDPAETIMNEINAVEKTGGTLLIPAFALERTQEILHVIMHLKQSGKILPLTPVYLDSPMADKATEFYTQYPDLFNPHVSEEMKRTSAFGFPGLDILRNHEQSHAIYKKNGTKVIIAGSGMMTGGKILGYAAHYLPMPSTRLLIVGFQGEGTIGRALLEGTKQIVVDGSPVEVNASVNSTQAMSSHADQGQLLEWLKYIKNVKKVILTHGDNDPRKALKEKISAELGLSDVLLPEMNQEISL